MDWYKSHPDLSFFSKSDIDLSPLYNPYLSEKIDYTNYDPNVIFNTQPDAPSAYDSRYVLINDQIVPKTSFSNIMYDPGVDLSSMMIPSRRPGHVMFGESSEDQNATETVNIDKNLIYGYNRYLEGAINSFNIRQMPEIAPSKLNYFSYDLMKLDEENFSQYFDLFMYACVLWTSSLSLFGLFSSNLLVSREPFRYLALR